MNNVHFAIPEIYGETLSYYELLRKLVDKTNDLIENYNTVPDQIAEAVKNLDASQLFSEVLNQLIHSIATDNTKSANAVKVYKKHDLLYATLNETVNLYESLIDFSTGTETELIVGSNIREVNISELFIELRKLIDINKNNIEAVTALANENNAEIATMNNDITSIENKNTEQDNELSTLRTMLSSPYNFKGEVASISALPASGAVNDTYYVQDVKYKVTWTGSAWVQSSLSEADYQTELNELKGDIYALDNKFTVGENLINVDELSPVGEWCNYTNGIIESNSYVTNYRHTPFIKVEPNTYYSRRYSFGKNSSVVYFDNSKKYIGYSSIDIFQTPNECAYVIVNIRVDIEQISQILMIKGNEDISIFTDIYPTPPYYEDFKYPNPNYLKKTDAESTYVKKTDAESTYVKKTDAESTYVKKTDKDYIVVAENGGDYTSVKEAFEYARANDKYVIIKPGVYDLVAEGISGEGYLLPKKVIGYGAKLVCNLENENWNLSPLNVDWQYDKHEVYGLEIECSNCRYCIHDEKGARTWGKYHHVFKDLHLIHNSNASSVLIAPNNIGGGIGNGGYIEIDNCVFEQNGDYNKNIDYHTSFTEHQDDSTIIKCTNSVLNKGITITGIGEDTSFMNKIYVSNCLCGTIPTSETKVNIQMIAWNNVSM